MVDYAELRAQAVVLRKEGFSLSQIGRRLGLHKSVIGRWVADIPFSGFNCESRAEQLRSFRDPELYNRALELRQSGWSYKMIEAEIGVPRSTLSGWLRYLKVVEYHPAVRQRTLAAQAKAVQANRRRQCGVKARIQSEAASEMEVLLAEPLSGREIFLMGLMLYLAEGGKTQRAVSITNSDPFVIRTFHQGRALSERFTGTATGRRSYLSRC